MMRLAFSLGSELPLHANPTVGGTKPHRSDTGKTWLWRCLALLAVLGLPWCVHAESEAESSASIDEVVTTIYDFDTLGTMARQISLQHLRTQLRFTTGKIARKQGREKALALHADLTKLIDDILIKAEWLLEHGAGRRAQIHERLLALPVHDRAAIVKCVSSVDRFYLRDADLAQARRYPPESPQGATDRYALFQKHEAAWIKLGKSACFFSSDLSAPMASLLAPRATEPGQGEPPSLIDVNKLALADLGDRLLHHLKSLAE